MESDDDDVSDDFGSLTPETIQTTKQTQTIFNGTASATRITRTNAPHDLSLDQQIYCWTNFKIQPEIFNLLHNTTFNRLTIGI